MRPIYKFIEYKYLSSFFETGSLRLGTVYNFKDTDKHGKHRGDSNEGKHNVARKIDGPLTVRSGENHPIISEFFKIGGEGSVTLQNISLVMPRISPDYFVFCTSHVYTEVLFNKWMENEDGIDSCYEIFNPHGFSNAISKAISSSAYYSFASDVIYTDEDIDYRQNLNPAITKRRNYDWQKEHRMLWSPLLPSPPLQPWNINVPEARKFCRPVAHFFENKVILKL